MKKNQQFCAVDLLVSKARTYSTYIQNLYYRQIDGKAEHSGRH